MRVLNRCWYLDRPSYIVVSIAELVGQLLDLTWVSARIVIDYHVVCGTNYALPTYLTHKEEVVSIGGDDICIYDRTW